MRWFSQLNLDYDIFLQKNKNNKQKTSFTSAVKLFIYGNTVYWPCSNNKIREHLYRIALQYFKLPRYTYLISQARDLCVSCRNDRSCNLEPMTHSSTFVFNNVSCRHKCWMFSVAKRESIDRGSILFLLNTKRTFVDHDC